MYSDTVVSFTYAVAEGTLCYIYAVVCLICAICWGFTPKKYCGYSVLWFSVVGIFPWFLNDKDFASQFCRGLATAFIQSVKQVKPAMLILS